MADKADRGLGPLEGTFHVEQTPAIGARVSRKKDSSRRQRERVRPAGLRRCVKKKWSRQRDRKVMWIIVPKEPR